MYFFVNVSIIKIMKCYNWVHVKKVEYTIKCIYSFNIFYQTCFESLIFHDISKELIKKKLTACQKCGVCNDINTIRHNEYFVVNYKRLTLWQCDNDVNGHLTNSQKLLMCFNPYLAETESLCHLYRARPACTSMPSDQAIYCLLTNIKFSF